MRNQRERQRGRQRAREDETSATTSLDPRRTSGVGAQEPRVRQQVTDGAVKQRDASVRRDVIISPAVASANVTGRERQGLPPCFQEGGVKAAVGSGRTRTLRLRRPRFCCCCCCSMSSMAVAGGEAALMALTTLMLSSGSGGRSSCSRRRTFISWSSSNPPRVNWGGKIWSEEATGERSPR